VPTRKCLLLTFRFPPYPGVGARRWEGLSKYLARAGTEVHVLTLDWKRFYPDQPVYLKQGVHVHTVGAVGPHWLIQSAAPESAWGRSLDRLRGIARRWDWTGLDDYARWWGLTMVRAASKLLREFDIPVVVATGPPHMVNYWAAILARRHPNVRLVQDFRDPWTDQHGYAIGHPKRLALATRREAIAIGEADAVVTVGKALSDMFRSKSAATPVFLIPNGYDPDKVAGVAYEGPRPFMLVHTGNLFVGRETPLRAFLEAVRTVAPEIAELRLVFRGGFPPSVRSEYEDLVAAGLLDAGDTVSHAEALDLVAGAFACLQFNSPNSPGALSTKIYEYAALRRPVLSVNYGGEIVELIAEHNLGASVSGKDSRGIAEELLRLHGLWSADPAYSQPVRDIERFSHVNLALEYAQVLFPD